MPGGLDAGARCKLVIVRRITRNANGADDAVLAVANQNAAANGKDPAISQMRYAGKKVGAVRRQFLNLLRAGAQATEP